MAATLQADRRRRRRRVLHRPDRRRHRRHRPEPAGPRGRDAHRAQGRHDRRGRRRLRRVDARPDARHVPRPRRLRHGAAVQRRLDDRRGAEHPRAASARPRATARRRCTPTWRPAALAYADRGAYLGDPAFTPVPLCGLLSLPFADARARDDHRPRSPARPVAAGDPAPFNSGCGDAPRPRRATAPRGPEHDAPDRCRPARQRRGATFTIEQTGGSGIVVPGRGFLLNNELTDFETATGRAELAGGRQAPALEHGADDRRCATAGRGWRSAARAARRIITTVLQIAGRARSTCGRSLAAAVEAPRVSDRNGAAGAEAEPDFLATPPARPARRGARPPVRRQVKAARSAPPPAIEFLSRGRLRPWPRRAAAAAAARWRCRSPGRRLRRSAVGTMSAPVGSSTLLPANSTAANGLAVGLRYGRVLGVERDPQPCGRPARGSTRRTRRSAPVLRGTPPGGRASSGSAKAPRVSSLAVPSGATS